jgi:hypothetical protein
MYQFHGEEASASLKLRSAVTGLQVQCTPNQISGFFQSERVNFKEFLINFKEF